MPDHPLDKCRRLYGRVRIKDSQAALHATVPACVLASLQLQHHNSAAIWPISDLAPVPAKIILHIVEDSCQESLQALAVAANSRDLQALMAAWIDAQTATGPEVPGQELNFQTCPASQCQQYHSGDRMQAVHPCKQGSPRNRRGHVSVLNTKPLHVAFVQIHCNY